MEDFNKIYKPKIDQIIAEEKLAQEKEKQRHPYSKEIREAIRCGEDYVIFIEEDHFRFDPDAFLAKVQPFFKRVEREQVNRQYINDYYFTCYFR